MFKHIFIVGAGGIGSHLIEPLCRMQAYHRNGTKAITLIDGDVYEAKNQIRQLFPTEFVGMNKAEATAKRIKDAVFEISYHGEYVNLIKFNQLLEAKGIKPEDPILVIAVVDNNATRKILVNALDERRQRNFVFISGGNGYSIGQALVYSRWNAELLTMHPFEKYDEWKFPPDHIPGEGCADEAPDEPQLITANAGASTAVLWTVQAILEEKGWYEEVHFDSVKMAMAGQGSMKLIPARVRETVAKVEIADLNSGPLDQIEIQPQESPAKTIAETQQIG